MSLEEVLKVLENDSGERRNPEKYYFSIFGTPAEKGIWGYRVEGHHLSQNYTVVNGRVAASPSFFGANPAEVRDGPRKGLRALAAEEDLGRAVLETLDPEPRKIAVVDQAAYKDILTAASRKAALNGQPSGLSAAKMNARQFEALRALVEVTRATCRSNWRWRARNSSARRGAMPALRLGRRRAPRRAALLPRAGAHLPHRIRRHAE